ncbi:hypothetical protein CHS0354_007357, partial [Potamilus streckersoni]
MEKTLSHYCRHNMVITLISLELSSSIITSKCRPDTLITQEIFLRENMKTDQSSKVSAKVLKRENISR